MHGDPRFTRFFAYLNLFAASMLILVLGSSFIVTFLGWEGVGLCSYLLISHWFERDRAAVAGQEGVRREPGRRLRLHARDVLHHRQRRQPRLLGDEPEGRRACPHTTVTAIALLLFVGCVGKSAQIPLHVWLPDAMEGPTPVSALIHAATMVTAGVYLVCRSAPVLRRERRRTDGRRVGRRRDRLARRDRRAGPAGHQEGPRVLDDQPARVHVPGLRCPRVPGRGLHGARARLLQGHAVPRRRLGDPRQRGQPGPAKNGRAAQAHAVHRVRVRPCVPRDQRHPTAVGLLRQGRDHLGQLLQRRLRALDHRGRRSRDHRDLHDPRDAAHVLRQRAVPRRARCRPGARR